MDSFKKFISLMSNTLGTQVLMFIGISMMAQKFGPNFVGHQTLVFAIVTYILILVQLGFQGQGLKLILEGYNVRFLWLQHSFFRFLIYILILMVIIIYNRFDKEIGNLSVLYLFMGASPLIFYIEYYFQAKERFFIIGISRLLAGFAFFSASYYLIGLNESFLDDNLPLLSILPYLLFIIIPPIFLLTILVFEKEKLPNVGRKMKGTSLLKQSFVMAIGVLMIQLSYRADKFIIAGELGTHSLGIYDSAYKFINVALNLAWILYFILAKRIKIRGYSEYIRNIGVFFLLLICGLPLMFFLAPYLILYFFGEDFIASIEILKLLLIPLSLMVMNVILLSPMNLFGMEKQYTFILSISTVVNVIMNFALVPSYGIHGSVYSMIISEVLIIILFYSRTNKKLLEKLKIELCSKEYE